MDFKGEHIWIIGASTGMGRALAIELAQSGASLILSARDAAKLQDLNNQLGCTHQVFPLDVTDYEAVKAVIPHLESQKIDRIIFMAGTYEPMNFENITMEAANVIIDTNFKGALHVVLASLPALIRQGNGQIALCASIAGYRGLPRAQPYGATKAALINLAESLYAEIFNKGIDIKIINPGFVRTPMTDKNNFKMPMMIETNEAARSIAKGLKSSSFEIHFPKKFTILMKILTALSAFIYLPLVRK